MEESNSSAQVVIPSKQSFSKDIDLIELIKKDKRILNNIPEKN